ncbi:MAG: hypothetical protein WAU02_01390 [Candidatus Saccharimonadales bacterium]
MRRRKTPYTMMRRLMLWSSGVWFGVGVTLAQIIMAVWLTTPAHAVTAT